MHRNLLPILGKDVVVIHLFLFDIVESIVQTVVIVDIRISDYMTLFFILKIIFGCH